MRVSSLRSLYGDDDMAVPRSRRVADVAAALLVSRAYTIFAGVQVVLNVALFVWVRSLSSRHGLAQAYPVSFFLPSSPAFVFYLFLSC